MSDKILLVDDEPQLLQAISRQLRKRFNLYTAEGGEEALAVLKEEGPFAVIVADMKMPGMNGVELLNRVKDVYPETVRLMLTGNADQETAVEAVNKGQIFRFLNKPCPASVLIPSLALGMRHHQLIIAEKELLDETLRKSVEVMSQLLTLANATAFSIGPRIEPNVRTLAEKMDLFPLWQYEISALMSQMGCITVPTEILHKVHAGLKLDEDEWETYQKHPGSGARMISQIPRLEQVAAIISYQLTEYDKIPADIDDEIAIGAHILKAAIEYDMLRQQDIKHRDAVRKMQGKKGWYNPDVLELISNFKPSERQVEIRNVRFRGIVAGMIADEDVVAKNGTLLIPKDQKITWAMIESLTNFVKHVGIEEPIRVRTFVQ